MLYALMGLVSDVDRNTVLIYLTLNILNYYGGESQRKIVV
jgi:hypothetical protein